MVMTRVLRSRRAWPVGIFAHPDSSDEAICVKGTNVSCSEEQSSHSLCGRHEEGDIRAGWQHDTPIYSFCKARMRML